MIGVLVGNDAKETKYGNTKGGKEKRSLQKGCLKINKAGKKSREPEVVALQNYTKKCKPMLVVGQNCQKPIHFYKGFQNPISLCFQESGRGLPPNSNPDVYDLSDSRSQKSHTLLLAWPRR
jgi:hypothetical protein